MGLFDRLGQEMQAREKTAGLTMSDVLALPDDERKLLNWMMRQEEVSAKQTAERLGSSEATATVLLEGLVEKAYLREIEVRGQKSFRVRLAPKRGRDIPLNIWQALDGKVGGEEGGDQ